MNFGYQCFTSLQVYKFNHNTVVHYVHTYTKLHVQ